MFFSDNQTMPVRVLQVVTYMGRGGLETMLMNYYRHIDRTKVQFDFLVHREFRADYDDEIESLGGRIYRLHRLVPWSRNYRKALNAFFAEHPEYKIIHVHQDCMSAIILKAAQKHGVSVRIAHSHNSNQDKNLKYLIKLFYKHQIPKYATQLFACGKEAGDWMFGGAPYKIIYNAIDSERYVYSVSCREEIRQQLGIPADTIVIGHVGRFHPQKNHSFLIDVFSNLKKKEENAVLLLVGEGDLRKEIEKKAITLGLYDSIIFTGVRSDVPDLMQAMDCFVFPSRYEGLGIVAIEAQAAGLACVVSDGVPLDCDITDLVEHIPLNQGATVWSERVLDKVKVKRSDRCKDIVQSGYDIATNAQWLQNYYIHQWKKEA